MPVHVTPSACLSFGPSHSTGCKELVALKMCFAFQSGLNGERSGAIGTQGTGPTGPDVPLCRLRAGERADADPTGRLGRGSRRPPPSSLRPVPSPVAIRPPHLVRVWAACVRGPVTWNSALGAARPRSLCRRVQADRVERPTLGSELSPLRSARGLCLQLCFVLGGCCLPVRQSPAFAPTAQETRFPWLGLEQRRGVCKPSASTPHSTHSRPRADASQAFSQPSDAALGAVLVKSLPAAAGAASRLETWALFTGGLCKRDFGAPRHSGSLVKEQGPEPPRRERREQQGGPSAGPGGRHLHPPTATPHISCDPENGGRISTA